MWREFAVRTEPGDAARLWRSSFQDIWRGARPEPDPAWIRKRLDPCPELDCIRHLVLPSQILAAERRSAEIGTGADRVLVTAGVISDAIYARAFAFHHGIAIETLSGVRREECPLRDDDLLSSLSIGILPLEQHGELIFVIAPWQFAARYLIEHLQRHPDIRTRVRMTTMEWLRDFVHREAETAVACKAAYDLRAHRPDLSAGASRGRTPLTMFAAGMAALVALAAWQPTFNAAFEIALALIFLGWNGLRVVAILLSPLQQRLAPVHDDRALPIYSIVVAVYDEAESVSALAAALMEFNYPKERLDIKIVVEREDMRTRLALDLMDLGAPFEIVIAPMAGPRTKPKALNAALPFVRGRYVAVYDAEDRPEPMQLRMALSAFRAADEKLACVQARLTIDNTADSWLTRLFTAEYAGLFDVFLPGLAAFRMPLPLGGTSNHFRTDVLRKLGGWDPYNVTEDADLGIRIARRGLRTTVIPSSTYEEAPATLGAWVKQRTRWFKGYLLTWAVHMRNPFALWRDLGPGGFIVFQLVIGGAALAALVHGVFVCVLAWQIAFGLLWSAKSGFFEIMFAGIYILSLATGYAMSVLLGFIGLSRRQLLGSAAWLLLMPLYWILLSFAAWRAVLEVVRRPHHWEKTAHGLAVSSRLKTAHK